MLIEFTTLAMILNINIMIEPSITEPGASVEQTRGAYIVQPTANPSSCKTKLAHIALELTYIASDNAFNRGNNKSGTEIKIGIAQFANPPRNNGTMKIKIIIIP